MTIELWISFVFASVVLIAIPGPTNLMVMAYGFRHGKRAALYTVFGVGPGAVVAMALSYLGLGAVLAVSPRLFLFMKWVGAIYIVFMGINLWRTTPNLEEVIIEEENLSGKQIAVHAFAVSLLNPKHIIFYMAFVPQFISPDKPILQQMLLLGFTFLVLVFPINTAYALMSGTLRDIIRNQRVLRIMNRTAGVMLMIAGVLTTILSRS